MFVVEASQMVSFQSAFDGFMFTRLVLGSIPLVAIEEGLVHSSEMLL